MSRPLAEASALVPVVMTRAEWGLVLGALYHHQMRLGHEIKLAERSELLHPPYAQAKRIAGIRATIARAIE